MLAGTLRVAVCGARGVGKTSLIARIATGGFSLQHQHTTSIEVTRLLLIDVPVVFIETIETSNVVQCEIALLLCSDSAEVEPLRRAYARLHTQTILLLMSDTPAAAPVRAAHVVSNLTTAGIAELIFSLYIKGRCFQKCYSAVS
jgi:GTPase SAR1 family protein